MQNDDVKIFKTVLFYQSKYMTYTIYLNFITFKFFYVH